MTRALIIIHLLWTISVQAQYTGTGSVSQGPAVLLQSEIFTCSGGRVCSTGTSTANDNTTWVVPAATNFTIPAIPFASDLFNSCNGNTFSNTSAAIAALDSNNIVSIDSAGELITAYVFSDNYFEMYINGTCVGKDRVPYTPFNSSILQFRVNRPFTIAMHLVDWEEHLGLGSELNGGFAYHAGDGGMVAIFKNNTGEIITITDNSWKAQTFYTSPIQDLSCPSENGTQRLSGNCSTADVQDGSMFYALHWPLPPGCFSAGYNDTNWPNANTYTNTEVGVNNKPAYTNFTDLFDHPSADAAFIWSTNLILDNEVIVRKEVLVGTGLREKDEETNSFKIFPNPARSGSFLHIENYHQDTDLPVVVIYNTMGEIVSETIPYQSQISLESLAPGMYYVSARVGKLKQFQKLIVQ